MLRKLASLVLVALFTVSLAGSVLAAEIKGKVSAIEREGRYVTVKSDKGKEVVRGWRSLRDRGWCKSEREV